MKTLLLSLGSLLCSQLAAAQLAPADDKAIRAVINHWDANLNNHKFQEMSAYTTKDVSFITPIGMHWRGQQQVVQGHLDLFNKMYRNVPFKPSNLTVRSITPDVAVVNEEMAVGVSYPPDGVDRGTNKEAPWRGIESMVLVKKSGQWLVAAGDVVGINEKAMKQSHPMATAKR
ncbi:SgcJ/EcaC family oxidoreductase [Hymenobacter terricola]|uniref:SgcJ/EcaC family oxidoreductase n=1 Tax=Hymenobacter terricola TaxID=2819236 RepID=UPI001B3171BC|nr:SgcJ/EcaC family oxidoreductase [Hymenobacter terricola]